VKKEEAGGLSRFLSLAITDFLAMEN